MRPRPQGGTGGWENTTPRDTGRRPSSSSKGQEDELADDTARLAAWRDAHGLFHGAKPDAERNDECKPSCLDLFGEPWDGAEGA